MTFQNSRCRFGHRPNGIDIRGLRFRTNTEHSHDRCCNAFPNCEPSTNRDISCRTAIGTDRDARRDGHGFQHDNRRGRKIDAKPAQNTRSFDIDVAFRADRQNDDDHDISDR